MTRGPERKALLERFTGALLGGAMGDALGRPVEGWPQTRVADVYGRLAEYQKWHGWQEGPTGTITDDTQLTMLVGECLTLNGYLDPVDLSQRFVRWLSYMRGEGEATVKAVWRLQDGVPWARAGEYSAGNGAAMRSAPVGLARWNDPVLLRAEAVLSALPTHRHPMGVAGAVAMAAAVAYLVSTEAHGFVPDTFVAAVQQSMLGIEQGPVAERRDPTVVTTLHDRIGDVLDLLSTSPNEAFSRLYNGAYVLESLPAALYCFLRSPRDVEEMIVLGASMGRDADTVAAMAGTLGGALNGVEVLPKRLVEDLEYRVELTAMAANLLALAEEGDSTMSLPVESAYGIKPIPNSKLEAQLIPRTGAGLEERWRHFALTFDGYAYWGSFERCVQMARAVEKQRDRLGMWSGTLTELRTVLFWTQRWLRNNDHIEPDLSRDGHIVTLIEAIRTRVLLENGSEGS